MGVSQKWWGPVHLLHPLSVRQSRVTPVIGRRGRGSGAGRRGIEVVVVVATVTAKGQPAWARGEVGWVLACHRGVQRACVEGRCPAPLKTKGEKRGMTYLRFFLGALGTVRATAAGGRVCARD